MKKRGTFLIFRDLFLWAVGSLMFACSVNIFTVSGDFIQGGVTGIALMINRIFHTPVGTTMFILNIPLFIWAYFEAGKRYVAKTAAATFISSFAIDFTAPFLPVYTGDRLLSALFAGLFCGAGLGITYISGATTGGSDLAGFLISKHKGGISVGKLILIIDAVICFCAVFVYNSFESGMYAAVLIYVTSRVMDTILDGTGFSGSRIFFIITENDTSLCEEIRKRVLRGVTVLYGKGSYSGKDKKILLCAVRRHEISRMYAIVKSADPDAFILVCEASDIRGFGFSHFAKTDGK